jgi:competence protein ComFC
LAATHPQKISGPWCEGYALDVHVVRSDFLGYNDFGHPLFDTERSKLGELLYRLKYRNDWSVVPEIVEAAAKFLSEWNPPIDLLIPATPSNKRTVQPVAHLAQSLATQVGIEFSDTCLTRATSIKQLKGVQDYNKRSRLLKGAHVVDVEVTAGKNILVLDDLYQSGATLSAITMDLYEHGGASDVFVLALTRAKG